MHGFDNAHTNGVKIRKLQEYRESTNTFPLNVFLSCNVVAALCLCAYSL